MDREAQATAIAAFLYREAQLLDRRQWVEWLELWDEQAVYRMPQRVTPDRGAGSEWVDSMAYLDETKASLRTRVARLQTTSAWAETPPSRTRHLISNVQVAPPGPDLTVVAVTSVFLVLRSHRDLAAVEQLFGERQDLLRWTGETWKILQRIIYPDQTVLDMPNLSIFL